MFVASVAEEEREEGERKRGREGRREGGRGRIEVPWLQNLNVAPTDQLVELSILFLHVTYFLAPYTYCHGNIQRGGATMALFDLGHTLRCHLSYFPHAAQDIVIETVAIVLVSDLDSCAGREEVASEGCVVLLDRPPQLRLLHREEGRKRERERGEMGRREEGKEGRKKGEEGSGCSSNVFLPESVAGFPIL